jgi:hypothetical protein
MSAENLEELLSKNELNVKSEKIIFETVIKWITINVFERRKVVI